MLTAASYNLYLGADLTPIFGATGPEHLVQQAQAVYRQLVGTDFSTRAAAVARLLVRERVDVVGLQEVARWSRSPLSPDGTVGPPQVWCDFLGELVRALQEAGAAYDVHAVQPSFHGSAPISADTVMAVLGHDAILVRRDSGVRVLGARTGTFTDALDVPTPMPDLVLTIPRGWGWVDAAVDGARFRFVNTHLEAYDAPTRDAQREELVRLVGDPATPVIVAGDFNAPPGEVGMPADYQDAWVVAGDGTAGHTCGQPADLSNADSALGERIDYVWVRGAAVRGCRLIGHLGGDRTHPSGLWPSDHAGVVCAVDLR